jgi:hypothetical protein
MTDDIFYRMTLKIRFWGESIQWPGEPCVGIQKHSMMAEIPGFDLPNRLSDLTTSLFSSDGIGKLICNKVK